MVQPFEPVQQDDEQQQNQLPNTICHCLTSGLGVGAELLCDESLAYFEKEFRLLVREEVEMQLQAHFNLPQPHQSYSSSRRMEEVGVKGMVNLRLRFMNNIPSIIFTKDEIKAEKGEAVGVGLFDVTNNSIVETKHPLSSVLIEVVVLDGEFNVDEEATSQSDFDRNIVPQRMGQPPFLVGRTRFRLENGISFINNLSFTTNSSRSKTKNIRLGLRIIEDQFVSNNYYPTIPQAVSNPFRVKDRPSQRNMKHYPPKGEDEVWRLEGISLNGEYHKRLFAKGILTVDNFVKAYQRDEHNLRKVLGNRLSNKKWEAMVNHALEYVPPIMNPTFDSTNFGQSLGQSEGMENEAVINQNTAASNYNGHELADQTFLGDF